MYLFFLALFISISNCARKGILEGGPKDENPPLVVTSTPPYESTGFTEKNITIYFNEYITLNELNKQLIISPPLKNPAIILPQGTPSKYINIQILDTLLKNTTYTFNFGNSVEDNNEGNQLENFKYVFSTGKFIDSLTSVGKVQDALVYKTSKNINVLLYKIDSSYTDSIIYKKKPNYITNTLDTTNFNFSNLKKGKYFLIALKDKANDYLFNSKTDKIGFLIDTIVLPRDSIIKKPLLLFDEEQPFELKKATEVAKGHILFGFTGNPKNIKINPLSKTSKDFRSISKFEQDKDTLHYWFTPIEADSLNFLVTHKTITDTVTVRLRKKKLDSLTIKASIGATLHFRDTFFLRTNNPIIKLDTSKIRVINKDTVAINFKGLLSITDNSVGILFDKKPVQNYSIKILPNAISDIYTQQNDSLQYNFKTLELEDYGQITLNVQNKNKDYLIIELLDDKGILIERKFISETNKILIFSFLTPKKYIIRAIIDRNNNNRWDTGNFLKKILPEEVHYFPKELQIRANHYINEIFTVISIKKQS